MASKTGIKDVVESLCQILKGHGISRISPEILRQAKFDAEEATMTMWNLLSDILFRVKDILPVGSVHGGTSGLEFVTSSFQVLGYNCKDFYDSRTGITQKSQDLLIAFGWLLAKLDLVNRLLDDLETPLFRLLIEGNKVGTDTTIDFNGIRLRNALDLAVYMHQKQNHQIKSVRKLVKFIAKNASYQYSKQKFGVPFLSEPTVLELLMSLCSKKKFCLVIKELEKEKLLLESHIKWIEHEDIFWKWMSSVIQEKYDKEKKLRTESEVTAEVAGSFRTLSFLDRPHSLLNNSEAVALLSHVSKLVVKLSSIQLTEHSNGHVQRNPAIALKETKAHNESTIRNVVKQIKGHVTDTEVRLSDLREKCMALFDADSDDIMKDVIHLPMPRR